MNTSLRIFLIVMSICTNGFSQADDGPKALAAFKTLVRRHADSYTTVDGREHIAELGGGWAKERFFMNVSTVKYDVEKTSSLVSPFIGTLTFTLTRKLTAFHKTQAEAAADSVFIREDIKVHKHVFGYQDNEWRPTNRKYGREGAPLDLPCDEFLDKKGTPSERDIHGCLEEFDAK